MKECATSRRTMRVAALDLGKVRVGLAISDELMALAHPRPALDASNRQKLLDRIRLFAVEEEVDRFIVGLPLDASGQKGAAARKALSFADQVAKVTGLPVEMWDERFTTMEASRRLQEGGVGARKGRAKIDGAAACILLQSWMDRRGRRS